MIEDELPARKSTLPTYRLLTEFFWVLSIFDAIFFLSLILYFLSFTKNCLNIFEIQPNFKFLNLSSAVYFISHSELHMSGK